MSSTWSNNKLQISVFGESHGEKIGAVINGLPAGIKVDMDYILKMIARRAPGKNKTSTPRAEKDFPNIVSGVCNGVTTGAPVCCVIDNTNTHSKDYSELSYTARPGHADFTGFIKYGGFNDVRGGGHFSGRLTAPIVFAGAMCGLYLKQRDITVGAHVQSIKNAKDEKFDPVNVSAELLKAIKEKSIPVINDSAAQSFENVITAARENQDSVGGIIECAAVGVPAGLGDPMFGGIENVISSLVFGVPAIKGVEFGAGFEAAEMSGSENNDEFYIDEALNEVKTHSNNHGGILGGISSGMPIIFRAAVKPTPSIAKPQRTVDFIKKQNTEISVRGRHDPCIAIRAVPVIESCMSIALTSCML